MFRCVHCGRPAASLFREYSAGNIVLTPCENCQQPVDPYLEYDSVIQFIDLLLHKPAIYRHLLFNVIHDGRQLPRAVMKLCLLLILFDVYLKWSATGSEVISGGMAQFALYYLYFAGMALLELTVFHGAAIAACRLVATRPLSAPLISLALIVSSYARLLHLLMVIWDEGPRGEYGWILNPFVLTSNAEALMVLLVAAGGDSGNAGRGEYPRAYLVVGLAAMAKYCLQRLLALLDPALPVSLF